MEHNFQQVGITLTNALLAFEHRVRVIIDFIGVFYFCLYPIEDRFVFIVCRAETADQVVRKLLDLLILVLLNLYIAQSFRNLRSCLQQQSRYDLRRIVTRRLGVVLLGECRRWSNNRFGHFDGIRCFWIFCQIWSIAAARCQQYRSEIQGCKNIKTVSWYSLFFFVKQIRSLSREKSMFFSTNPPNLQCVENNDT